MLQDWLQQAAFEAQGAPLRPQHVWATVQLVNTLFWQSAPTLQPQKLPEMHTVPCVWPAVQSVQAPELPHALLAVPAWHWLFAQHPPTSQRNRCCRAR